jgi:hypothetical protein
LQILFTFIAKISSGKQKAAYAICARCFLKPNPCGKLPRGPRVRLIDGRRGGGGIRPNQGVGILNAAAHQIGPELEFLTRK